MTNCSITVTLHPLRWVRNILIFGLILLGTTYPINHWNYALSEFSSPPKEQLIHLRAVSVVETVLAEKSDMVPDLRLDLARTIVSESVRQQIDPLFILALIEAESQFKTHVMSVRCREVGVESTCHTNARGLMQVIPSTWKGELKRRGLPTLDPLNPVHNVQVGVGYVAYLGTGFKRITSLLWAYNQGALISGARAKGTIPSGWEGERWEKAIREGTGYETKVTRIYRKLLERFVGGRVTYATMQDTYRNPRISVYSLPVVFGPY